LAEIYTLSLHDALPICLSNMKQQGLAVMMYAQDYDETLPCWWLWNREPTNPAGWGDHYYWYVQVLPYVKSRDIFRCPSASGASRSEEHTSELQSPYDLV